MRVFISYAAEDVDIASRLATTLQSVGHSVFLDRGEIRPGDQFPTRIRKALLGSQIVVFLLTQHSAKAGSFALSELKLALDVAHRSGLRVIPVQVEPSKNVPPPAFASHISHLVPVGDLTTEIVHEVESISNSSPSRGRAILASVAGLLVASTIALLLRLFSDVLLEPLLPSGSTDARIGERITALQALALGTSAMLVAISLLTLQVFLPKRRLLAYGIQAAAIPPLAWLTLTAMPHSQVWADLGWWDSSPLPQSIAVMGGLTALFFALHDWSVNFWHSARRWLLS